jgi:hypothetical protein
MKLGDLIIKKPCGETFTKNVEWGCNCMFCTGNSNRVGVVTGIASRGRYYVSFDVGEVSLAAEQADNLWPQNTYEVVNEAG